MDLKIIFLGAVQGLTEFLPISSSAHLSLFQMLFGYQNMLGYDITLHFATLFAVLFFFRILRVIGVFDYIVSCIEVKN